MLTETQPGTLNQNIVGFSSREEVDSEIRFAFERDARSNGPNVESWEEIRDGLRDYGMWDLAVDASNKMTDLVSTSTGEILVATRQGVFWLDRDDDTWHPVNTGLSSLNVLTLALSDEDFVFAGTEHGIFRSVEAIVTAVEPDNGSIPGAVKLLGNYPNPFSVQTTITFSVNEAGHGELVVYDVNGRMVAKLHDGPLAPGAHRATWDALGQPSGVYLYRLVTEGAIRTGRMVALRSRN